jgi:hypothetical protein
MMPSSHLAIRRRFAVLGDEDPPVERLANSVFQFRAPRGRPPGMARWPGLKGVGNGCSP